jgi:hypothetical protein
MVAILTMMYGNIIEITHNYYKTEDNTKIIDGFSGEVVLDKEKVFDQEYFNEFANEFINFTDNSVTIRDDEQNKTLIYSLDDHKLIYTIDEAIFAWAVKEYTFGDDYSDILLFEIGLKSNPTEMIFMSKKTHEIIRKLIKTPSQSLYSTEIIIGDSI